MDKGFENMAQKLLGEGGSMVIENLQEAHEGLQNRAKVSPIDCPNLQWSYKGWGCLLTERRRDHYIEECPLCNGGTVCYDVGEITRRKSTTGKV